jgi:gliding motility-associated-like protein
VEVSKATCRASAELQVVRAPVPEGKLPSGVVICSEPLNPVEETKRVSLDPGRFVSYQWFKNDIQQTSTNQVFVAESPGLYRVDLTNSFNCKASDETEVINDCLPIIKTPNAFRPDSDLAENRDFFAFSLFIEDNFRVYIYNRWGEMIYQSSDKNFKWNGGYHNDPARPAPSGTYAWIMEYMSAFRPDAGYQTKRGGVLLIR